MSERIHTFQKTVWDYYHQHGRELPWRLPEADGTFDPYKILVSEMMLQQTQVRRVIPKYLAFIKQFPNMAALATAPLSDVLTAWSGLGYNRRAKYLHDAAKQLALLTVPWTIQELTACKGIGVNTAAAVMAYAYNQPVVFIETNIRAVYIHHFFATGSDPIADKGIMLIVQQTLDSRHPREWYWALMDYGTYLKSSAKGLARQSKHYAKQSAFHGSSRQIRGQVLKLLIHQRLSRAELELNITDKRLFKILMELEAEKLITREGSRYSLAT